MVALVSIVIPCYNQAEFLDEAIESAVGQTYRPLEIVVVDDGSTDATAEVTARYGELRYFRQQNQGAARARNAGLRASRGQYVVFLDADDRLLPHAVEVGVASLDAHPQAAFTVGRYRRIAVDGTPLSMLQRPRIRADHYVSLVKRCWIDMPATVMYRRAPLEAVGAFDGGRRYADDYDLYLRIARRYPIVDHYEEVAEYRQHAWTLSRNAEAMLPATLAVLDSHRPGRDASAAHWLAWRARDNAVWYYERLLDGVRADVARRNWLAAARGLLLFTRHLPRHPGYALYRLLTPLRLAERAFRRRAA